MMNYNYINYKINIKLCALLVSACFSGGVAFGQETFSREDSITLNHQEEKSKRKLIPENNSEDSAQAVSVEKPPKKSKTDNHSTSVAPVGDSSFNPMEEEGVATPTGQTGIGDSLGACPELPTEMWSLIIKYVITDHVSDKTFKPSKGDDISSKQPGTISLSTYYSLAKPYEVGTLVEIFYDIWQACKIRSLKKDFYNIINELYYLPLNPERIKISEVLELKDKWCLPTNVHIYMEGKNMKALIAKFNALSPLLVGEGGPLILKELDLDYDRTSFSNEYYKILSTLSQYSFHLTLLRIGFDWIDLKDDIDDRLALTTEDMNALYRLTDPRQTPKLKQLELTLPQADEVLENIYPNLRDHQTLKTFFYFNSYTSDYGALYMAEALRYNRSLTTIFMGENRISDVGVKALLLALYQNTTLKSLDISRSSEMILKIIPFIVKCLKHNQSLLELGIGGALDDFPSALSSEIHTISDVSLHRRLQDMAFFFDGRF